ncbi:hypothetical protein O3M35_006995 [Rhynocoris fuscipes]|uniref:Uncharacterized protein n=1 Tax=Rhynocoris fuscipes TaxID=488301 RepID=A0AAW1DI74_9HEMI
MVTEGASRYADIVAFDSKNDLAYVLDRIVRFESNDESQAETIANEKNVPSTLRRNSGKGLKKGGTRCGGSGLGLVGQYHELTMTFLSAWEPILFVWRHKKLFLSYM